ncbi:uncharacterized protein LOC122252789 [Penaeus japonicus]|uniref:uncharacterized protein LOC122252789 n=1 Tax=Penaeus japonicus TaxID=27405 RepID=UPI001C715604|nr:uncharacterized protein LOC122252789 [Penaeus japonicus]XP_042871388.1 uncharacterized protein LOC122252789 [Penaeus japonicus]XP_042871389.1 uncharacterized protein LOC122252789 [Penaeus japonicus]
MADKLESGNSASESLPQSETKPHFWIETEKREDADEAEIERITEGTREENEEDDEDEGKTIECDLSISQPRGNRMITKEFTINLPKFGPSQESLVSDASNGSASVSTSGNSCLEAEISYSSSSSTTTSSSSTASSSTASDEENYEAHMSSDSAHEFQGIVRTLQHYRPRISRRRRRRRRRLRRHQQSSSSTSSSSSSSSFSFSSYSSVSSDSDCSCVSCASSVAGATKTFFGKEVGPPGGEASVWRRAVIWLEGIKYLWGIFIYGMLVLSVVFFAVSMWMSQRVKEGENHMLSWSIPFMVLTLLAVIVWQGTWHTLIYLGYGDGDHVQDRRNFIEFAQKKELVYTIRGAIYAPSPPGPNTLTSKSSSKRKPPSYSVVSYESEYDSELYFDSDLDVDGQYRRSITPWREIDDDPVKRERRNIYTRKAWRRDVPVIWWEVWNQPPRDF